MNPMELSNVIRPDKVADKYDVNGIISNVIWELATKNPLWRFKAVDAQVDDYGNGKRCMAHGFEVSVNGEKLGVVKRDHKYREGNRTSVIAVSNKRIRDSMQRSNFITTTDDKKALALVKKWFYPESTVERISQAKEAAQQVVYDVVREKQREQSQHDREIREAVTKFISTPEGSAAFTEYVNRVNDPDVVLAMQENGRLMEESATIEDIRTRLMDGNGETALIIVDQGKYLVKILEDVQLYDDTTLPFDMRGKLGMLKLVQPRQFVSSVGCRVNNEVFVIVINKEGEANE
jgi:hypothetical protein